MSRQLWWGHRIPAYYIVFTTPGMKQGNRADDNFWVCAHDEEEAKKKAAARFNVSEEAIAVHQGAISFLVLSILSLIRGV